jgi:hypothetical protein
MESVKGSIGTKRWAPALVRVGDVANLPRKGTIMKLGRLSALSAAALLAGGMTFAVAQSNQAPAASGGSPPGANAAAQGKCWDAASNSVKDKSTQTASGQKQAGGATTGAGPSGNAANSTGASPASRPAGMANC